MDVEVGAGFDHRPRQAWRDTVIGEGTQIDNQSSRPTMSPSGGQLLVAAGCGLAGR